MKQADVYLDLKGREISLADLTASERSLIADMKAAAKKAADWSAFSNLWMVRIADCYADQNLTIRKFARPLCIVSVRISTAAWPCPRGSLASRIIAMNLRY